MEITELVKDYANVYNELTKVIGVNEKDIQEVSITAQIALLQVAAIIQQSKIIAENKEVTSKSIARIIDMVSEKNNFRPINEDDSEYRQPGY